MLNLQWLRWLHRNSHPRNSIKKLFLKNLTIFTGKICINVFFEKVADLKAYSFIEKGLQHRYYSVNIAKFVRTPIFKNICEWQLLTFNYFPTDLTSALFVFRYCIETNWHERKVFSTKRIGYVNFYEWLY